MPGHLPGYLRGLLRWPRPAVDAGRWLVIDIESSGLDPRRDRLLSIAAVAVRPGPRLRVCPGDSFEVVLRQPEQAGSADKANVLVHGIGLGAQRAGTEPAAALRDFEAFAGNAPLIGYHAAFDRALLRRAARGHRVPTAPRLWLDLAELGPVLCPQVRGKSLDDWLAAFGIGCLARHQAAADALATAQLLQRLWPLALQQPGRGDFQALARLAAQRRWLAP